MTRLYSALTLSLSMLCATQLVTSVAFADKPTGKESGKHQKQPEKLKSPQSNEREYRHHEKPSQHQSGHSAIRQGGYFSDRHRSAIRDYYAGEFRSGHCPPGLAKKHNGCLPPGQAKKWALGRPLPRDVIFYDLPPAVALAIGPAPAGYRYVRVASDILLIAVGTGMVMDAIADLGGL